MAVYFPEMVLEIKEFSPHARGRTQVDSVRLDTCVTDCTDSTQKVSINRLLHFDLDHYECFRFRRNIE
jgi:hypothetical protein